MNNYWKSFFLRLTLVFIVISSATCVSTELGSRGKRYKYGGAYIGSNPSMSCDGGKIVLGSTRYGLGDICTINSDGSNWVRLTHTPEYEGEPAFSPDGGKVVFISERDGNGEIYIMNYDGSDQTRLTHHDGYDANPSFSPDGSKIVFARNINDKKSGIPYSHISIMDSDGKGIKRITFGEAWYSDPKFSQEGKKLIFKVIWQGEHEATGIGMINVDGSDEVRIKKCLCHYPSFSPSSNKILFVADWRDEGEWELWTMTLDSYTLQRVPLPKNIDVFHPTYIKGGSKILFLNGINEKGGQICTIDEDGTNLLIIADTY